MQRVLNHLKGQQAALPFKDMPGPAELDYYRYRMETPDYITHLHEVHGPIFRVEIDGSPFVFLREPESVKFVLTSEEDFDKTFADADEKSSAYIQYFKISSSHCWHDQIYFAVRPTPPPQSLKKCFSSWSTFLPQFHSL